MQTRRTLAVALVLCSFVLSVATTRTDAQAPGRAHVRAGFQQGVVVSGVPGETGLAAVQRILDATNAALGEQRLVQQQPGTCGLFLMVEEDSRRADGRSVALNREVIFFASVRDRVSGQNTILILDNLLSSPALVQDLVEQGFLPPDATPTATAHNLEIETDEQDQTKARFQFRAGRPLDATHADLMLQYKSGAPHASGLPAALHLANRLAEVGDGRMDFRYRHAPARVLRLMARGASERLLIADNPDVALRLHVRHEDPDVDALYQDIDWRLIAKFYARLFRFEELLPG